MTKWTTADMPSQTGKTAIVTGGSSGLGYETAKALAKAGAGVTIASSRVEKALDALNRLRSELPDARVTFLQLDLGDLKSVERFAGEMKGRIERLDILVDCAGIFGPGKRESSAQGFEKTLAVNYLGHFALTGRLLDKLKAAPAARVVTYASLIHRAGRIDFEDLQLERSYDAVKAYSQAKLATLLFARELDRRASAAKLAMRAMPVHPGGASTNLFKSEPGEGGLASRIRGRIVQMGVDAVSQKADAGALPGLYAATSPQAQGGQYYGPDGFMEMQGYPKVAKLGDRARDETVARRLWDISEDLTGVRYGLA